MAGGPVGWISAIPISAGDVFELVYTGDGAVGDDLSMLGVTDATGLTADGIWRLVFAMPIVLPTGTAKLRLIAKADATSGVMKINPKWKSVAVGEVASHRTRFGDGDVVLLGNAPQFIPSAGVENSHACNDERALGFLDQFDRVVDDFGRGRWIRLGSVLLLLVIVVEAF